MKKKEKRLTKLDELAKKLSPDTIEELSKFALDVKDLKSQTIPNPIVLGGMEAIGLKRISPFDIPQYLLMHPALPRGIELKVNRMIKLIDEDLKSNIIKNPYNGKEEIDFDDGAKLKFTELAEKAADYCKKITYNSGGPLFLKSYSQEAYRFGTSFVVLQPNKSNTEILRFEVQHPIFFGPALYPSKIKGAGIDWGEVQQKDRGYLAGKMRIDPKTKKISKYTQLTKKYPERSEDNYKPYAGEYVNTRTNPQLKEKSAGPLVPVGDEIDQKSVMQLMFDRIGDEPLGISLVQFLHLTIKYLLNMEKACAQTMVNFGFNKWVSNTPFKDIKKMQAYAKTLANIQKDSVVVLPEGIELKNIVPGITEFDRIHPIYMRLIAIRLGIPMPLLSQDGTTTNKATIQEMRKDMYEDFIADELTIEVSMNDGFYKACQVKWPELTLEQLDMIVPKFKFKQPPDDIDTERERDLKFTLSIRNLSNAAEIWTDIGDEKVLALLSRKVKSLVERSMELDIMDEDIEKEEKRMLKLISTKQKLISVKKGNDKDIDKQVDDLKKDEKEAEEKPPKKIEEKDRKKQEPKKKEK